MSIQHWLGEMSKSEFVADFFHKVPFARRGGGLESCSLGRWSTVVELLAQPETDVMVVRRGTRFAGPLPRSETEAQSLVADGYTILIRHAEQHHAGLAQLAAEFAADFAAPVNVHVYATPAEQFGFGWHYDAEEVFLLQTVGAKEYSFRKNTVHPWPLVETIPADMHYERELMPLMKCLLTAGDWLYLPAGYWHRGDARELSVTLAVGVLSPSAIDVFDLLRRRLIDSLRWRQRLPTTGRASPLSHADLRGRYRELLRELGSDLQKVLASEEFLTDVLEQPWAGK